MSLLLLTDVVANTAGNLVGSLVNEVVVTEGILEVVSGDCLTCEGRARGLGRTPNGGPLRCPDASAVSAGADLAALERDPGQHAEGHHDGHDEDHEGNVVLH